MRIHFAFLLGISAWTLFVPRNGDAAEYYVAPTGGSDSNNGSLSTPFATFGKAIGLANPGDTIFARGGTYNLNSRLRIQKSGATNNPINLFAYPGETPVLNFASMNASLLGSSSGRGIQIDAGANWWRIKGLTIENAKDNGVYSEANHGVFEQLVLRANADSGFQLSGAASNNLVLNSDSYLNYDPHNNGENSDGFAAKFENLGPGNIMRGLRAWGNSDDGWDMWESTTGGVLVENSWSFDNGFNVWGDTDFQGDGNGFKLGQMGGPHVLNGVVVWNNAVRGIDVNGNGYGVKVFNSTVYDSGRNWQFDETEEETLNHHLLQNNISFAGTQSNQFLSGVDHSFNTWNGISVDAADFLSLDDTIARGPRSPDGSLPASDFLKLASNSNLIDSGTPISFVFNGVTYSIPFNGVAPDLGAYETSVPAPALPGDYNGDNVVDALDYTVWRDHLDTSTALPNDETPGVVDAEDYEVWKSHFGQSLAGAGGKGGTAVPEPETVGLLLTASLTIGWLRRGKPVSLVAMDRLR